MFVIGRRGEELKRWGGPSLSLPGGELVGRVGGTAGEGARRRYRVRVSVNVGFIAASASYTVRSSIRSLCRNRGAAVRAADPRERESQGWS